MANVCAVEHLKQLVIIDAVLDPPRHTFELLVFNGSVLVGVIEREDSLEAVFGLEVSNFGANNLQELFEVDGFVLVSERVDEAQDEGAPLFKSKFFEGFVDFCGVDGAAVVLIKNEEGFSEFIVVLLGEAVFPAGCFGSGGGGRRFGLGSAHGSHSNNKN